MKRWVGALAIIIVGTGAVYATSAPSDNERICALEAALDFPVYDECVPPTTTTIPPTTTTTLPPTTTTLAPTTTTVPATTTTTEPFVADPMVLAQIAREDRPFDIILTSLLTTGPRDFWTAVYDNDLGNGYGWIAGDRAGYQKAYMFLVNLETGQCVGRVSFWAVTDSDGDYFSKVNDRYMDEIQTTRIGYDCETGMPADQGQAPGYTPFDTFDDSPEVRPVILFRDDDGVVIENRSYTNTVSPPTSVFRFTDGGYHDWIAETGSPRVDNNGYDNAPHNVYFEQTVYARLRRPELGNHFWRAIGIEYVSFLPDFPITNG